MGLDGGPDLVLRLLQVDLDPLRLDAVKVRVDEELDAVALGIPDSDNCKHLSPLQETRFLFLICETIRKAGSRINS